MFEKSLEARFQAIFEVKKISYNAPGASGEQECLFIEIETARNSIKDGRALSMVTGSAVMNAPNDKLPFGFFSKKIAKAGKDLTKPLFFFDIETNTQRYQNLVQRGFSFVYFFDSQYDPDTGIIESVEFTIEES